ncbi:MAG: membrane protein insertase YidC [Deltaproteobacteria bacterium]|nr:membrane protein insertase YidC [Deltaproteobacteria bacterium]
MDRRTIFAVVLALATFFAWDAYMKSRYPDRYADLATTEEPAGSPESTPGPTLAPGPLTVTPPEAAPKVERPRAPEREIPYQACGTDARWTTAGGFLRSVILVEEEAHYEVQPIYRWIWDRIRGEKSQWKPYGDPPGAEQLLTKDARVLGMGSGGLKSASPDVDLLEDDDTTIALRGVTDDGIEVTRFLRTEDGDPCTMAVTTTWRNVGSHPYAGDLWLQLHDVVPEKASRYSNVVQPYAMVGGKYKRLNLKKVDDTQALEGAVDWMALADRYFVLVLIPEGAGGDGRLLVSRLDVVDGQVAYGLHYVVTADLAPGAAYTESYRMYVGPKELSVLKTLHERLPKLVNLGMFAFFGKILLTLLKFFHTYVGQWGLAIIVLTVFVKLLFFPLTQTSFKSSQAMSSLQPELKEIREKYKESPEELNRHTMALFKERGVNPLGGCLPMLIQFPVWIALYQVLLNSVELYHTEFLYLRDLSSVDPYGALPFVVVILMVVQQQFMPTGNMDPTQAKMMKLMPLMFGFFFFAFPAGLVVYIFVNMVLTILQQWIIRRTYKTPEVAAATT